MEKLKTELIKISKKLTDKGMSPGYSGNVSVRYGRYFLVTPSGFALDDLTEKDIVLIDENFKVIDGKQKPSSESKMHLEIYKLRNDIKAIIHCHAPKSSAFSAAGIPLSEAILAENIYSLGPIPIAGYNTPSSDELAQDTASYFKEADIVLMQNHGVVLGAKDLKEAFYKMDTVEYFAEVYLYSKILGGAKKLNPKQIKEIENLKN